jgi:hypothetical protein
MNRAGRAFRNAIGLFIQSFKMVDFYRQLSVASLSFRAYNILRSVAIAWIALEGVNSNNSR